MNLKMSNANSKFCFLKATVKKKKKKKKKKSGQDYNYFIKYIRKIKEKIILKPALPQPDRYQIIQVSKPQMVSE